MTSELQTIKAVRNIVAAGIRFPTPWAVEQSLLQSDFKQDWRKENKIFDYIFKFCQKVDSFVALYFALKPVVALIDLEKELCRYLHSFCTPSLNDLERNPEEVEICFESGKRNDTRTFDWFGLGPLIRYPSIKLRFHVVSSRKVNSDSILRMFKDYQGSVEAFPKFVLAEYGVNSLCHDLNVSIDPLGLHEFEIGKRHLYNVSHVASSETTKPIYDRPCEVVHYKPRKLKRPLSNPDLNRALEKVERKLNTPFSPSFKKLKAAVRSVSLSENEVRDTMCAYFMLHLGSGKYRKAQFETPKKFANLEDKKLLKSPERCNCSQSDTISHYSIPQEANNQNNKNFQKAQARSSFKRFSPDLSVSNRELRHLLPSTSFGNLGDMNLLGRWGESLVYQCLLKQFPEHNVLWINEFQESKAPYDIKIEVKHTNSFKSTRFVEGKVYWHQTSSEKFIVKSTKYPDKTVFEISLNEWSFLSGMGGSVHYDIYRVYSAGDPDKVRIEVFKDVYKKVLQAELQLCIAV